MPFLEKNIENVRKNKDIKLATTEGRKNYLVSEPNCHTTKFFISIEIKKKMLMNKVVYLGIFMLELGKTLFYEFSYDYGKPKYGEKAILVIWMRFYCVHKNR